MCGVGATRLSFELGDQGSSPGRTSTQGLKITEEKVLPLLNTSKWLDFGVFSDKDIKHAGTSGPLPIGQYSLLG